MSEDSPSIWTRRNVIGVAAATLGAAAAAGPVAPRAAAASTVHVSTDFGFDPDDSTAYLEAALASGADTVVVDDVGAEWITGPLTITQSHQTVQFEDGVVLRAKPGAFENRGSSGSDCLITVAGRTGVTISGYGATLMMNRAAYEAEPDPGEWRHVLNVRHCTDLTIEGLTLTQSGGDGIYLGQSSSQQPYNKNVTITDVSCDGNRRNGLSVISVDGLLCENSSFTNTTGTGPKSGIDLEPNVETELLKDILIKDCAVHDNGHHNVAVVLYKLTDASADISITFDNVTIGAKGSSGAYCLVVQGGRTGSDVGGSLTVRNCQIVPSPSSGGIRIGPKRAFNSFDAIIEGTTIEDVNNTGSGFPLRITGSRLDGSYPVNVAYGGVVWDDCTVITDKAPPFLTYYQPPNHPGMANVSGTISVHCPAGVEADFGPNPDLSTIDLDIIELPA